MAKQEQLQIQEERSRRRRHVIKSYKQRANAKRSFIDIVADWMTNKFGTVTFLIANLIVFAIWLAINSQTFPWIHSFDPFPYGLLTMAMSIEAIILAIIVLISQNREARISEIREEIDLQVNLISEEENVKILELLSRLMEKEGIDLSQDQELQTMLRPIRNIRIEERIEKQLSD